MSKTSKEGERPSRLTPDQVRQRVFQRAIRLLTAKPRSIAELRERLLSGRPNNKAAVEAAIERLKEYGYLDDERFALGYASFKVMRRPIGRRRLERDLALKKVDPAVAGKTLDLLFAETTEEQLIDRAIEKRFRLRGRPKKQA